MIDFLLTTWTENAPLTDGRLIFSILIGLAFGSFLNVCIDRLPLQHLSQTQKKQLLSDPLLSDTLKRYIASDHLTLATPTRSLCFACGYQLAWYENIPVFSYLCLKGQCRQCQRKYGQRSFWVELLNGIVYGLLYSSFGFSTLSILLAFNVSFGLVYGGILQEHGRVPKILNTLAVLITILDLGLIVMKLHS